MSDLDSVSQRIEGREACDGIRDICKDEVADA
jgi:hypothetical protein